MVTNLKVAVHYGVVAAFPGIPHPLDQFPAAMHVDQLDKPECRLPTTNWCTCLVQLMVLVAVGGVVGTIYV